MQKAFQIAQSHYDDNNPWIAHLHYDLAQIDIHLGKFNQAQKLLNQAQTIYEKNYGEYHRFNRSVYRSLAALYQKTGKQDESQKFSEKAMLASQFDVVPPSEASENV